MSGKKHTTELLLKMAFSKHSKTNRKCKKPTTEVVSVSSFCSESEQNTVPLAEQINIEQLFAQAFSQFQKEEISKKHTHNDIKHLSSIIEEYMSGYMLMGYTLTGEQVVIFDASTPKDESAVIDLLRSTFFDIASKRP